MPGAERSAEQPAGLAQGLLRGPQVPVERRPDSRWAYPVLGLALVSLFIAYHSLILLLWVLPGKSLIVDFRDEVFERGHARTYFGATRNTQSWAMFAPNPTRANVFMRVLVTDQQGEIWDLGHDLWGTQRWPYIWYDRKGKVNRRIDAKKHYQRIYGAWVCRQWAREREGQAPKSVQFVRRWTWVPEARQVMAEGGWDPWQASYEEFPQETITCAKVADGILSNELRARYGFEPIDETTLRRVEIETWWTEREAERVEAELGPEAMREAEREAEREAWKAKQIDARRKTNKSIP